MTATVVSIALVVLIVFVFVYTTSMNQRARAEWATAEGRIVASRVEARTPPNTERPGTQYGARVMYEYTVAGKTYRGERVSFDGTLWRGTREAAEADCARFAEGARVSVFYDPGAPQRAVLELRPR